jgi:hypothetical protein
MSLQSVLRSFWTLRLGLTLALLPMPAFVATALYSASVMSHAQRIPEDIWPLLPATILFLVFAGVCLVPGVMLLWSHLHHSRLARWVFGISAIEIILLGSFIVYVNVV